MDDSLPPIGDAKPAKPEDGGSTSDSNKVEAVVATLIKIDRANRKAENAENKRNHSREKRRFVVEIIEIVLVSIYAFFTILEWKTFNSERITLEKESKASQIATADQLAAIVAQTKEARIEHITDERAWVFVNIPDNAFSISTNYGTLNASIRNTGKTPALVSSVYSNWSDNPTNIPAHDPFGTKFNLTLVPQRDGIIRITFPIYLEARILQNTKIYFFGTAYYSDIYTNSHWCQFCFSFQDNGDVMNSESFHTSCDDLEKIHGN